MKDKVVMEEHEGFFEPTNQCPEVVEKQKRLFDMNPRKKFLEKKRERVQTLIELSPTIEEADKVITENYHFKSVAEKIAFLKGMFNIHIISKHDSSETTEEESYEMDYWTMLLTIINS